MANVSNKLIERANLLMQQEKWWKMFHLTGCSDSLAGRRILALLLCNGSPIAAHVETSRPWSRGTSQTSLHQHAGSKKIRWAFHFIRIELFWLDMARQCQEPAGWRRIAKLVGFHPNCRGILQCSETSETLKFCEESARNLEGSWRSWWHHDGSCHSWPEAALWGPVDLLERCQKSIGKSWTILHTNNAWLYNW